MDVDKTDSVASSILSDYHCENRQPIAQVHSEVEWGRLYRMQKDKERKGVLKPALPPIDYQNLWTKYQITKRLEELKLLEAQIDAKPRPKLPLLPTNSKMFDRNAASKKRYFEFLATPPRRRIYVKRPPPHLVDPREKRKLKARLKPQSCSARILYLSAPRKARILFTWKDYASVLPIHLILRLEERLHQDKDLDPKFARCYFNTLDRKKRKQLCHLKRLRRRQKKRMKIADKQWYREQNTITVDLIVNFFRKEPIPAVNFKEMLLSEGILSTLAKGRFIKRKPVRGTNKSYSRAIIDISDQVAVWLDKVVRYVDLQHTESLGDFGLPADEEEELLSFSDYEEGTSMGDIGPPLASSSLKKLIHKDMTMKRQIMGEEDSYGGEDAGTTDGGFGKGFPKGFPSCLDVDALDVLISILSNTSPDDLQELIDNDMFPEITYQDVLEKLKVMRNNIEQEAMEQRKSGLERIMHEWAMRNDPSKVDKEVDDEIKCVAGVLASVLAKEKREAREMMAGDEIGRALLGELPVVKGAIKEGGEGGTDVSSGWDTSGAPETEAGEVTEEVSEVSETISEVPRGEEEPGWADAEGIAPPILQAVAAMQTKSGEIEQDAGLVGISADERSPDEVWEAEMRAAGIGEVSEATEGMQEIVKDIQEREEMSVCGKAEEGEISGMAGESETMRAARLAGIPPSEMAGMLPSEVSAMAGEESMRAARMAGEAETMRAARISGMAGEAESMRAARMAEMAEMAGMAGEAEGARQARLAKLAKISRVELGEEGAPCIIKGIIVGHKPSKVIEHRPDMICCLTLKIWATWLLEVAHNAHLWSRWLNDIINEVRRIASIIRGEVMDADGNPETFSREEWVEFGKKVDKMIVSWRQYSMHVCDLTDKIMANFRDKQVFCCPKCLQDNLIVDVVLAHNITEQLAEAMTTACYWRRWLDGIVMETSRLTQVITEEADEISVMGSDQGGMEVVELHSVQDMESDESIYEIEELELDIY